jgi:predicted RNA-binding protein YlqC (UPF0109 family)
MTVEKTGETRKKRAQPKLSVKKQDFDKVLGRLIQAAPVTREAGRKRKQRGK